jgi:hypothetical protein
VNVWSWASLFFGILFPSAVIINCSDIPRGTTIACGILWMLAMGMMQAKLSLTSSSRVDAIVGFRLNGPSCNFGIQSVLCSRGSIVLSRDPQLGARLHRCVTCLRGMAIMGGYGAVYIILGWGEIWRLGLWL